MRGGSPSIQGWALSLPLAIVGALQAAQNPVATLSEARSSHSRPLISADLARPLTGPYFLVIEPGRS